MEGFDAMADIARTMANMAIVAPMTITRRRLSKVCQRSESCFNLHLHSTDVLSASEAIFLRLPLTIG